MQYQSFDFRQLWNLDLYDRHHAAFHGAVKFVIPILVSPAISIQNPRFSVTLRRHRQAHPFVQPSFALFLLHCASASTENEERVRLTRKR